MLIVDFTIKIWKLSLTVLLPGTGLKGRKYFETQQQI